MDNKYDLTKVPNEVLISIYNYMLTSSGKRITAEILKKDKGYRKGFQINLNFNYISICEKEIKRAEETFKEEIKKDVISMLGGETTLEEYLGSSRYKFLKSEKENKIREVNDRVAFLRQGIDLLREYVSNLSEKFEAGEPVMFEQGGSKYIMTKGNAIYVKPIKRACAGVSYDNIEVVPLYSESKDKEFIDVLVANINNLYANSVESSSAEEK